jgi:uncharacterized protein (DUF2267 family)
MSAQGLQVIDHTVQLTHEWINELTDRLDWTHQKDALRLMRVVMHQVRDHLQPDELAQFSAQLPLLIRGMLFEGWVPKRTPVRQRDADVFVEEIEGLVGAVLEYRGREDIQAVFKLLNARLSRGEVEDIRANLPGPIRDLWPTP